MTSVECDEVNTKEGGVVQDCKQLVTIFQQKWENHDCKWRTKEVEALYLKIAQARQIRGPTGGWAHEALNNLLNYLYGIPKEEGIHAMNLIQELLKFESFTHWCRQVKPQRKEYSSSNTTNTTTTTTTTQTFVNGQLIQSSRQGTSGADAYGNVNCVNCHNCSGCVGCVGCSGCVGCVNSVNCRNCVGCNACVNVTGLTGGNGVVG